MLESLSVIEQGVTASDRILACSVENGHAIVLGSSRDGGGEVEPVPGEGKVRNHLFYYNVHYLSPKEAKRGKKISKEKK